MSAEAQVLAAFPYHRIIDALDQLSTEVQAVVISADIHGCRKREIAEIMHIPHGTVLSRLRRALKRSRAQVAEVPNDRVCNGSGEGAAKAAPHAAASRPLPGAAIDTGDDASLHRSTRPPDVRGGPLSRSRQSTDVEHREQRSTP